MNQLGPVLAPLFHKALFSTRIFHLTAAANVRECNIQEENALLSNEGLHFLSLINMPIGN